MSEYQFCLTSIFPYKDNRIEDCVLIQKIRVIESTYSGNIFCPVYLIILRSSSSKANTLSGKAGFF